MWNNPNAVVVCPACRYPHEAERCPNPGCDLNLSPAVKAERSRRAAEDAAWTANFRRFYHGRA